MAAPHFWVHTYIQDVSRRVWAEDTGSLAPWLLHESPRLSVLAAAGGWESSPCSTTSLGTQGPSVLLLPSPQIPSTSNTVEAALLPRPLPCLWRGRKNTNLRNRCFALGRSHARPCCSHPIGPSESHDHMKLKGRLGGVVSAGGHVLMAKAPFTREKEREFGETGSGLCRKSLRDGRTMSAPGRCFFSPARVKLLLIHSFFF